MSMKQRLKVLIKSCHSFFSNLSKSIIWIIYVLRHENLTPYIKQKNQPKKLLILANGPKLNECIKNGIPEIECSDIRVVNDFCRSELFFSVKPTSYVFADPFFFSDEMNERHKQIWNAFSKVNWNMTLFVPYLAFTKMTKQILNPNIKICPYHPIPYEGWKSVRFLLYKKGLSMPRPQNVVIPSIFIGINEGYKQIDLYGVDHSWTKEIRVNNNNQVCLINSHFFDNKTPELKPWHKGIGEPVYKMHEILRDLAWMFDGYYKLREYADNIGCRIINKTPDSFIDAFEREIK